MVSGIKKRAFTKKLRDEEPPGGETSGRIVDEGV
jgi:hypothetical protein